jgi:cellulose synthase/poly-beta-1,6-N-acetylglucosamine synthase-like glycosyltransferase
VRHTATLGPAAARNTGAASAVGDILVFVDADVIISPGALDRMTRRLDADLTLAAVFGSYDDSPREQDLISRYRNLLHHHVHQNGRREATSFWSGFGAIRKQAFAAAGGFDATRRAAIEDIELGFRLVDRGYRIQLDATILCKHLKRWTLWSMVRADFALRALPWSRLMLRHGRFPDDLNVTIARRWIVALTVAGALSFSIVPFHPAAAFPAVAATSAALWLDRAFLFFLARRSGWRFAVHCAPLHLLHQLICALAFSVAVSELAVDRLNGLLRLSTSAQSSNG